VFVAVLARGAMTVSLSLTGGSVYRNWFRTIRRSIRQNTLSRRQAPARDTRRRRPTKSSTFRGSTWFSMKGLFLFILSFLSLSMSVRSFSE